MAFVYIQWSITEYMFIRSFQVCSFIELQSSLESAEDWFQALIQLPKSTDAHVCDRKLYKNTIAFHIPPTLSCSLNYFYIIISNTM